MKIIVTGGGTAGHVTPLLAVASEIKKDAPDAQIRYIGKKFDQNLNSIAINHQAIDKKYVIFAGKLRRFHGKSLLWYLTQPKIFTQNLRDLFYFIAGLVESLFILIFWRPNVVFVKGGYVGLPVGLAAAFLRIPIVTHDSDILPGLTNRVLSRYATKIGVGQPIANYKKYPTSKLVYCGVPIKKDYFNPPKRQVSKDLLGIDQNSKLIVLVGGSLGAVRLNRVVQETLGLIAKNNRTLYWLCGYHHYQELKKHVEDSNPQGRVIIEPFSHEVDAILNAADVVVSRTGATFLAELAALGKATILVPNPLLTGGHQVKNALVYERETAAVVLQENQLKGNPKLLSYAINKILNDDNYRKMLETNMAKFAVLDAAKIIARLIINVGSREK